MLKTLQLTYSKYKFMRFVIVGLLNTLFGYLVFSFFILLGFHYSLAIFFALIAGIIFNFFTYSHWVFYINNPRLFMRFGMVYLFLYGLNIFSIYYLLILNFNTYFAQALITFPMVFITYKLNKNFVFNL